MAALKIKEYDSSFYDVVTAKAHASANVVLPVVLNVLPEIKSAVDFGCGQGMWLQVLSKLGVSKIFGLDGHWIDQKKLQIPESAFRIIDFEKEIVLEQKFDLAISLEVAEHISKNRAVQFVESLTEAADFVLFSAAIPFQGGTKHVNEQWPNYWCSLFEQKGFQAVDCIRPIVWGNLDVAWFYKQNIMLFVKKERLSELKAVAVNSFGICADQLNIVHPELFIRHMKNHIEQIDIGCGLWKLCKRAIKKCLGKDAQNQASDGNN